MRRTINWKLFSILLGLNLIGVACVFPYVVTLQGELLAKTGQPIGLIFFVQLIQSLIMFSIAIFLGLYFTKKIDFRLPVLTALLEKTGYQGVLKDISPVSILMGIGTALAIYLLDPLFSHLGADISTHQNLAPVWQKLLATFYAGVTEETMMRLFIMTFFIWLGMKIVRRAQANRTIIWIAIILAAIIFGLGHLPITAALTELTPLIVLRAIVLNGIGGIAFGYLFWKKGFESAMLAHFTTDIFLLTLLPLFFS